MSMVCLIGARLLVFHEPPDPFQAVQLMIHAQFRIEAVAVGKGDGAVADLVEGILEDVGVGILEKVVPDLILLCSG